MSATSVDSIAVMSLPDAGALGQLLARQCAAFQARGETSSRAERRIDLADAMAADFGGRARLMPQAPGVIGACHGQSGFERFSRIKPVLFMSRLTKASVFLRPPFGALAARVPGFMRHNRRKREAL